MQITIKEHIWIEKSWPGLPWRIYHTFTLGVHRQKQYDIQGVIHHHEGPRPPIELLAHAREHAKGAFLRTKELRKATAKHIPITFHVEQP